MSHREQLFKFDSKNYCTESEGERSQDPHCVGINYRAGESSEESEGEQIMTNYTKGKNKKSFCSSRSRFGIKVMEKERMQENQQQSQPGPSPIHKTFSHPPPSCESAQWERTSID